jgi:hypothetical protein
MNENALHTKIYIFIDFATYVAIPTSLSNGFKHIRDILHAINRFRAKKNKGM